jgi:hypothetical protein
LACHLQIDADLDPDLAHNSDADPDPAYHFAMRIRKRIHNNDEKAKEGPQKETNWGISCFPELDGPSLSTAKGFSWTLEALRGQGL